MQLDDLSFASRLKEVVTRLVKSTLNQERPPYRYGYVAAMDLESGRVTVIYPGEYEPISLPCAGTPPPVGSLCKIDGVAGDRHVIGPATFFTPAMGRTDKCGFHNNGTIIPPGTYVPGTGSSEGVYVPDKDSPIFCGFKSQETLILQGGMQVIHEDYLGYLVGQDQIISSFIIPYSGIYNVSYNLSPNVYLYGPITGYMPSFYARITSVDGTVKWAVRTTSSQVGHRDLAKVAYVGNDSALPLKQGDKVCLVFWPNTEGNYGWLSGQFSIKWVGFNPEDVSIPGDFIDNLKAAEAGEDILSPDDLS